MARVATTLAARGTMKATTLPLVEVEDYITVLKAQQIADEEGL
jgi:uncharacterized protein with GYD domain